MDFASDAQIVPDRATPRSTCSPVEDGQEISFTEIVTTSRVGRVNYHARDASQGRSLPSRICVQNEAERRMGIVSDAQIVPDRATPRSTCSPVEDGQEIVATK